MQDGYEIRAARPEDLPSLASIEREAAAQFRDLGFDGAFLDETADLEDLAEAQQEERLWVATSSGACVGFAIAGVLDDGMPWLEEIDVHPDHGRRGLGRALVEKVAGWARARGAASLGLSTFRDVPWNAPFYARLGFRVVARDECSPAVLAVLEDEAARGLPMERRVAMRLDLAR